MHIFNLSVCSTLGWKYFLTKLNISLAVIIWSVFLCLRLSLWKNTWTELFFPFLLLSWTQSRLCLWSWSSNSFPMIRKILHIKICAQILQIFSSFVYISNCVTRKRDNRSQKKASESKSFLHSELIFDRPIFELRKIIV